MVARGAKLVIKINQSPLSGWPVPDCMTLCRRQKAPAVQSPNWRADEPMNLLLVCTGIKFLGDGNEQARNLGVQGRSQWHKVHLSIDTVT